LLIVSPFDPGMVRPTRRLAEERNRFVTSLAAALWIPHASAGGQTAQSLAAALAAGKPVFLGDSGNDATAFLPGVREYRLSAICEALGCGGRERGGRQG
jgi:hypothetical protein